MRLLRFPQLKSEKGIPFCRVHIDRLERANKFPSRIRLGTNTVARAEEEVDAWITARMKAREDRILEPAGKPAPKQAVACVPAMPAAEHELQPCRAGSNSAQSESATGAVVPRAGAPVGR